VFHSRISALDLVFCSPGVGNHSTRDLTEAYDFSGIPSCLFSFPEHFHHGKQAEVCHPFVKGRLCPLGHRNQQDIFVLGGTLSTEQNHHPSSFFPVCGDSFLLLLPIVLLQICGDCYQILWHSLVFRGLLDAQRDRVMVFWACGTVKWALEGGENLVNGRNEH